MNKFKSIVFAGMAVATFAAVGLSSVSASSPGQLTGGSQVYEVKNITQGGSYANSASANPGDVVQFSTELHNAGDGGLTNIMVKATLPSASVNSFTSNVTATPAEGAQYGTTGSASVNLSSAQTVNYVTGSTKLYKSDGTFIRDLSDGITGGGVNVGDIPGSTMEYVNFQAKASTPPTTPPPTTPPTTVTVLPNTGAGDVAELFVGTSAFGAAGHFIFSRRNRR